MHKNHVFLITLFCVFFALSACQIANVSQVTPDVPLEATSKIEIINTETPSTTSTLMSLVNFPAMEVTQNDITLSLLLVYMDDSRIGVEYDVSNMKVPLGYTLACPVQSIAVSTSNGYDNQIPIYAFADPDRVHTTCTYQEHNQRYLVSHSFYHDLKFDSGDILVDLRIQLGGMPLTSDDGAKFFVPEYPAFTFKIKIQEGKTLTLYPNQTLRDRNVEVVLERIVLSPSTIIPKLCISYENFNGWYPQVSLRWDGQDKIMHPELTRQIDILDRVLVLNNPYPEKRCYEFISILQERNKFPETIKISLDMLSIDTKEGATQNDCQQAKLVAQKTYPDLDFSCAIDDQDAKYSFDIKLTKIPPELNELQAMQVAENAFIQNISGKWVFEIKLSMDDQE